MDEWNEWAGSAAADGGHWTASRQADNLTACLTAHTQPDQTWAVTARSHQSSPVQSRTGQDRTGDKPGVGGKDPRDLDSLGLARAQPGRSVAENEVPLKVPLCWGHCGFGL